MYKKNNDLGESQRVRERLHDQIKKLKQQMVQLDEPEKRQLQLRRLSLQSKKEEKRKEEGRRGGRNVKENPRTLSLYMSSVFQKVEKLYSKTSKRSPSCSTYKSYAAKLKQTTYFQTTRTISVTLLMTPRHRDVNWARQEFKHACVYILSL